MATEDELSSEEAAMVFRRAAELDQERRSRRGQLDLAAIEQAGMEAGLSRDAIRRAIVELRSGALDTTPGRRRWRIDPKVIIVARTVPGTVEEVERQFARFFRHQAFELRRQEPDRTTWARAEGLVPGLRRSLGKLALKDVTRAVVAVVGEPSDPRVAHVRVELDLTNARRGFLVLPWVGAAQGTGPAVVMSIGLWPIGLLGVGIPAALATGGYAIARVGYRGRRLRAAEAVEGLLDRLEHGRD